MAGVKSFVGPKGHCSGGFSSKELPMVDMEQVDEVAVV